MSVPASQYSWGTITDVENRVGAQNVLAWSNPGGVITSATTRNDSVCQNAISYADGIIYGKFRNSYYAYPLSPFGGGTIIVNNWWIGLVAWQLYQARGFRDDKDKNKYQSLYDQAMSDMGEYLSGTKFLDAQPAWPQPSGPVAIR
jgi:hypothetical protein